MVKVICRATECSYNADQECTLNRISLDATGECEDFEEREDE